MRCSGNLIRWDDNKGFGFISHENIKTGVFIHIKSFNNPKNRPELNNIISYELNKDIHGRYTATNAAIKNPASKPISKQTRQRDVSRDSDDSGANYFSKIVIIAFVIYLLISTKFLPFVVPFYLVMGLITYLIYSGDKQKAQSDEWRTPESTLLIFGLIGGWVGAIIAHRKLRHKNRKMDFQAKFWITVIINWIGLAIISSKLS